MIVSMTAFSRLEDTGDWGHAIWEIKTVNHRYLDMTIRLPEELRMLENRIREQISNRLGRGKVDCALRYDPDENTSNDLQINRNLADKLTRAAQSLAINPAQPVNPVDILRWPGVIEKQTPDPDIIGGPLFKLLDSTLDILIEARRREGHKIQAMILERCEAAAIQIESVRKVLPTLLDSIREKLLSRAREISADIENDRLEQELVFLAQKMDVAEELDRLDAHLEEVKHALANEGPIGRRLDFLMQEMNREANTLGSKAASMELSSASVELKVLIEQMREQIQNIE